MGKTQSRRHYRRRSSNTFQREESSPSKNPELGGGWFNAERHRSPEKGRAVREDSDAGFIAGSFKSRGQGCGKMPTTQLSARKPQGGQGVRRGLPSALSLEKPRPDGPDGNGRCSGSAMREASPVGKGLDVSSRRKNGDLEVGKKAVSARKRALISPGTLPVGAQRLQGSPSRRQPHSEDGNWSPYRGGYHF